MASAGASGIAGANLRGGPRGSIHQSRARQMAIYLAHVSGPSDFSTISRLSGRDRTTVRHACARMEEARDRPTFDFQLGLLEQAVSRMIARLIEEIIQPME